MRGGGGGAPGSEYNESQELENLQRVFQILSHQKPGALTEKETPKVTADKLADALKKLQYKCKRTDVEDMIWEVDEDCDGMISWDEFKAMFYRVRTDKTGWEPRRLFNVVEFMMHDKARRRRPPQSPPRCRRPALTRRTPPHPSLSPHTARHVAAAVGTIYARTLPDHPASALAPARRTSRHPSTWTSAWRSSSAVLGRTSWRRA